MTIHRVKRDYYHPASDLLIVDSRVDDSEILLSGLKPGTDIFRLLPGLTPLEQIAATLKGRPKTDTVHILAHGAPGALALSGETVDVDQLDTNASAMATIKAALGASKKIALWACSVSAEAVGKRFVNALADATGAKVFASDQPVGAAAHGGHWDIGIPAPFAEAATATYPHTLPTFDGVGGSVDGNQTYTEADNGDGITLTVVFADDVAGGFTSTAAITDAAGLGGTAGNVFFQNFTDETQTVTVSFSSTVTVTSFQYLEGDTNEAGTYTFTPTGGTGTAVVVTAASFDSGDGNGVTVSPTDWVGVTGFTVTNSLGAFSPALDTIVYSTNNAPTITGLVSDIAVTEETSSNLDMSATAVADLDGDSLVLTLTASAGTLAATSGGSVTVGGSGSGTLTLSGTAANINTFLDTASNIQYTGATDDVGNDAATLTLTANDGTVDSSASVANLDITGVNDDPTISGLVSDLAFTEDTAGDLNLSASAFADVDSAGSVTVTLTASEGTMTATSGGSVTVGGSGTGTLTLAGTVANINTFFDTASNVQYTGSSNDSGNDTATVSVTANDGDGSGAVALGTVNLDITNVNDAPTAANNTVSMNEDTSRVFTAADFNFADVDMGDTLASVRIDTLTVASGTFRLSGVTVSASDVITIADINAGNLVYTPAANANGNGLLTFTFSVNDGTAFAAAPGTLTVNVTDVAEPVPEPVVQTGGAGDDVITGGGANDTLRGGEGNDRVSGGGGNDIIGGGTGDDLLEGDDGSDDLVGGTGNDTIFGTSQDNENGDLSSNEAWGGAGNDTVVGGLGADVLGGGDGDDNVDGASGADTLFGGADSDTLDGGGGDDLIFNGGGDDTVSGGTGNDTLWAGAGDDMLSGGGGADVFTFGATSGNDTISDFDVSADSLDLSFSSLDDLAAVTAAASDVIRSGQDGLLINLGGGSVFVVGLDISDLASMMIDFG